MSRMAKQAGKLLFSCICNNQNLILARQRHVTNAIYYNQLRGVKKWVGPTYKKLYWRRIEQGPEPERHRSEWINWNYQAEIFAFGKRLGEDFNEATLMKAFTHRSYIEKERETRTELDVEEDTAHINLEDNSSLILKGEKLSTQYIKAYLRHSFPALPEEGICAVSSYLTSEEVLAYVASNLGMTDLALCGEFPPSQETLSDTVKAVVGGLSDDQGRERAELFVQDFIITQLIGKDIMELWSIVNPMGILQGIVKSRGQADVESRLLFETGTSTVLAAYMVGVYSDKQLLGKGYGETSAIAEEMAARDALRHLFGTTTSHASLPFGNKGHGLQLDYNKANANLHDYIHPNQLQ